MNNQYLKTIPLSFYSPSAYKNAFLNWRGYGIKYFLLVTFISTILITATWMVKVNNIAAKDVADKATSFILSQPNLTFDENINRDIKILEQIPKVSLRNGEFSSDAPQPYHITDPVSGRDLVIIDTTGEYKSLHESDAKILITRSEVIWKKDNNIEQVMPFQEFSKNSASDEQKINDTLFMFSELPAFTLKNGKFYTEDNKLYQVHNLAGKVVLEIGPDAKVDTNEGFPVLAINTDGITYNSETLKADALNEDFIYNFFLKSARKIKSYILAGIPLLGLPILTISSFLFGLLSFVFYGALCHFMAKIMKAGTFDFKQSCRIAAVAATPTQILTPVLPFVIPSQGLVYFIITVGYIYFGIKSATNR